MSSLLATRSSPVVELPPPTADLERRVLAQLGGGPYAVLRTVRCECDAGRVTLRGTVPTFFLKQMAQTLASKVPGVTAVENRLEVVERA